MTDFALPDAAGRLTVMQFAVSGGGVKRHILEFAARHDRSRFRVVGVGPDAALSESVAKDMDSRYRAAYERLGLPFIPLEVPRWHALGADVTSMRTLSRLLRQVQPDILHCHSSKAGYVGRLAALAARTRRVCYTPHAMFYTLQRGLKRQVYLWAERFLTPLADAIVAVSESEYLQLRRDLWAGKRLVRINNGIQPYIGSHDAEAIRAEYGLPAAAPLILTPARCEPQKDVRTLVLAMAEIVKDFPDAVLAVAGEGCLRPGLEALSRDLGLTKNIRFLGWIDRLEPLMAASDIVALSSFMEGLPYAVLEASAMGKPVVGSDVTGTRDCIRDGETGFLLPVGDAAGFAERIVRLCRDPDLRRTLGEAGKRLVAAEFGVDRMVREMEALYERLAESRT